MTWPNYHVPVDEAPHVRETRLRWQRKEYRRKRVSRLAHAAVYRAIRKGTLTRSPVCEKCGKKCKTLGHHKDYHQKLDVEWLCYNCHRKAHGL